MHPVEDTIAAISSPPGGAARGIVRLSGPDVLRLLKRCCNQPDFAVPGKLDRPQVVPADLYLEGFHCPVPCQLYLWPQGRSYTGQPVAEIHTFGSPAVLEAVLDTLCTHGARLAEPGEFTLRAFLAGRIDLTQAEAVLGVIDAADARRFQAALEQLAGGLRNPLSRLREELIELLAHLEAGLDFADEDIAFITPEQLASRLAEAAALVSRIHEQMASRAETVEQVRVVLSGRPNVGKSSLFNALVDQPRALVSEVPGTTRDYLMAELHFGGLVCQLIDTAGAETPGPHATLRPASQPAAPAGQQARSPRTGRDQASPRKSHAVEAENPIAAAQTLAHQQRRAAQVELFCVDATRELDDWERAELQRSRPQRIVVLTKTDAPRRTDYTGPAIETSSVTGAGLDQLRRAVEQAVCRQDKGAEAVVPATAVRCADSLRRAAESLARARRLAGRGDAEELVAAELRAALDALGEVTGTVCSEDILDRIFQRFCIGK